MKNNQKQPSLELKMKAQMLMFNTLGPQLSAMANEQKQNPCSVGVFSNGLLCVIFNN